MKRWIAGMMAAVLIMGSGFAAAEEHTGMTDAEIQESLESREGEGIGTLAENLFFIAGLLKDEEVRNLFQIQDVRVLMNEAVFRVANWLIQNRPVTMEILAEFGVGEHDRLCVGKIWDSYDRVTEVWNSYMLTEDCQLLMAEIDKVASNTEITDSVWNFLSMITSTDVNSILRAITSMILNELPVEEQSEEPRTLSSLEDMIDRSNFAGELMMRLMDAVEQSQWAQDSVPALLNNEDLKTLLVHLSQKTMVTEAIMNECAVLAADADIPDFILQGTEAITGLVKSMLNEQDDDIAEEDIIIEEAAE